MPLELTMGGYMMSRLDTLGFLERLPDMLDEDARTEEFCEEYERVLNRVRYEFRKSEPVPVRVNKVRFTSYSCGQCGHVISPNDVYCCRCGREIAWSRRNFNAD